MSKEATYYTISQSVNTVKSEIKRITNDNIIFSNRLIYGKLKKYRNLLLKRESDKSKLRNSNFNMFKFRRDRYDRVL